MYTYVQCPTKVFERYQKFVRYMFYKIFQNLVGSVRRRDRITSIKSETNLELYTRSKLRDIGYEHILRKDCQSIRNYLLHQETAIFGKTTFF